MSRNLIHDLKAGCRAFDLVFKESLKYQQKALEKIWDNSSVRSALEYTVKNCQNGFSNIRKEDVIHAVRESCERASMVGQGLRIFAATAQGQNYAELENVEKESQNEENSKDYYKKNLPKGVSPEDLEVSELHQKDKELIEKLEKEYEQKLKKEAELQEQVLSVKSTQSVCEPTRYEVGGHSQHGIRRPTENIQIPSVKKYVPKKQQLNPDAKQRRVPSSRLGRMVSFGSLAAGLGLGALAEVTRRTIGLSSSLDGNSSLNHLLLTEANAERIVNTLCQVRGAALKIGQIISIQDNTIINPAMQKVFERVRQSADFMPTWQVHKVLESQFGHDWREKLNSFEEKPFAAASIGQVHYVQLKDGQECAMKIQYPGVAQGIESDINNLVGILKIWNVFPEGLFIDNLVEVAKRELEWEVDYSREAECTKKFKTLLEPYPEYVVPDVIDELSTKQIFTSTLIEGIPVDQCVDLPSEQRNHVAKLIMQLCLREVFEFRYMQTDPNWSNFFYNPNTAKLCLLDFGATRSYDQEFVKKYIEVIKGAADGDREKVLNISQDMGFLTGYESKNMRNAHVDAVMILAEVFSSERAFDFGQQDTTMRIHKLVPTIVAERLCPPPEEIYSLHRKLSGVFLLCAKLKVKISCREMFLDIYDKFVEKSRN